METDEQQIRHLMDEWRRRTAENDLEGILALMTDDAVFLTPGNPPMTKQGFADLFQGFAGKARVETEQEVKEIHVSGDIAYAWTYISVVMTALDSGSKMERAGHALTVFRKSPSGAWLLARDANLLAAS